MGGAIKDELNQKLNDQVADVWITGPTQDETGLIVKLNDLKTLVDLKDSSFDYKTRAEFVSTDLIRQFYDEGDKDKLLSGFLFWVNLDANEAPFHIAQRCFYPLMAELEHPATGSCNMLIAPTVWNEHADWNPLRTKQLRPHHGEESKDRTMEQALAAPSGLHKTEKDGANILFNGQAVLGAKCGPIDKINGVSLFGNYLLEDKAITVELNLRAFFDQLFKVACQPQPYITLGAQKPLYEALVCYAERCDQAAKESGKAAAKAARQGIGAATAKIFECAANAVKADTVKTTYATIALKNQVVADSKQIKDGIGGVCLTGAALASAFAEKLKAHTLPAATQRQLGARAPTVLGQPLSSSES